MRSRVRWLVFTIASAIAISKLLRHDTDFGIYWRAAEELAHTDLDIFRSHENQAPYAYPHWVLLTFLPALCLPETIARICFGLMQGLATVWIVVDLQKLVRRQVTVNA